MIGIRQAHIRNINSSEFKALEHKTTDDLTP